MSSMPKPRPGIAQIKAYVPGGQEAEFTGPVYRMASNENPLGSSKMAEAAFAATAGDLHLYPDGASSALRAAIADQHGIDPARVICSAGSDELLSLLAVAYLSAGDEAIYTRHGFLVYRIAILAAGGVPVTAEEVDFRASVDHILAKVTERTKIVYLANPNNPTGTYLASAEIERLRDKLPSHVLLVLDAAYAEYVTDADYEAGLELVAQHENVVMTRTFSKIYGLASLRLGWLYGPLDVVDTINRIRGPFNVSAPASAAGIAAVQDQEFVKRSCDFNQTRREKLTRELEIMGYKVTPSEGNFLLVHVGGENGELAKAIETFLAARGILVRSTLAYEIPGALRVSIGSEAGNKAFLAALQQFQAGA